MFYLAGQNREIKIRIFVFGNLSMFDCNVISFYAAIKETTSNNSNSKHVKSVRNA